jgi:uncharacterized protein (DUF1015 family)
MIVRPFRGLRPRPDLAARIPSYPYDVLDSHEARRLADGDPDTFLHVVKAEIDLDPSVDPHDESVYRKAAENFERLRSTGRMVRDPRPAFYVYRLTMGAHVQTGIVGAAAASDYLAGRIKRHEHTRVDKELDRTRHTRALGANPGPIFLAHRGHAGLERWAAGATAGLPVADFTAPDGIRHALWAVDDVGQTAALEGAFAELPAAYIADGHHRAASYARVAAEKREAAGASWTGAEPWNFLLAVHFPAAQLQILDYNRLVRDLAGLDLESFLGRVRAQGFEVVPASAACKPEAPGSFGMFAAGRWFLLRATWDLRAASDPVARLDVAVLAERLLGPVLGIGDPRTDKRIDFVGGIRGLDELERRVRTGEYAAAFALHPTRMEDVMDAADAGLVMPPKSTWFEPKLRSGLVVHVFDER